MYIGGASIWLCLDLKGDFRRVRMISCSTASGKFHYQYFRQSARGGTWSLMPLEKLTVWRLVHL